MLFFVNAFHQGHYVRVGAGQAFTGPTQQSGNSNGQSLSVSSVAVSLDQRFQGHILLC